MTDVRVAAIRRAGSSDAVFGSGYLIAERLVLTAAHVVQSPNGSAEVVEVRLNGKTLRGRTIWLASGLDGDSQHLDAAVVEIDDKSYEPVALPPIRWGRIIGRGPGIRCSATGFPDAMVSSTGRAEPHQIDGTVNPLSRERRGMMDIIAASPPQWSPSGPTLWSGMSGAAVLSESGQLVIGVIVEVAGNFEDRLLTALPIGLLEQDESFVGLVEHRTGHSLMLEPVEMERIFRPWHRSISAQSPVALLRPEYEVAPFHGRTETLGQLVAWCENGPQVLGLLLHAPGGTGKTRLARELARIMYHKGWAVGEVSDTPAPLASLAQATTPILVVIDYAESRADAVASLLRFVAENPGQHPIRVLLLARSVGQWWEQLLQDYAAASVLREPPRKLGGIEFQSNPAEHLSMLSDAFQRALSRVPEYKGYAQTLPAFRLPWDLPRAAVYQPLMLHLAVLGEILASGESGQDNNSPEQIILRHEKQYWNRLAKERSIEFPETREMVLTYSLLCGAHSRAQAARTISTLPGFHEDSQENARRALAHWIATLYPPADPEHEYWGALTPDWLFEELLASTIRDEPDFLEHLARTQETGSGSETVLTGAQFHHAITVLTAAAAHPTTASRTLGQKLYELVAIHNDIFMPLACIVSVQSPDPTPLIAALQVLIGHRSATLEHLLYTRRFIPPTAGVLSVPGVSLQQRIVALLRDSDETDGKELRLAHELNLLSFYLVRNERVQEAVAASGESIEILRGCGATRGENALFYATALVGYANNLSKTGDWEGSYLAAREAVDLFADPSSPLPENSRMLAGALNCIYLYHEHRGEPDEAGDALARAVELWRNESPGEGEYLFESESLGNLLLNQANSLHAQGNTAGELEVRSECVEIFRQLYLAQPASYADAFQAQATGLAHVLEEAGRHGEAASLYGEAGQALLWLWNDGRSSSQLQLGVVLMLQAQELSRTGVPFAHVVHILERSREVLQGLFMRDPAMGARRYFEVLLAFIQGAQIVETGLDINPYMAEVAKVLDYIVSEWEAAGIIPDDALIVPNLAMFLSWTAVEGDPTVAVRWCERVGSLISADSDADRAINNRSLNGNTLMLKARALVRLREYQMSSEAAEDGAGILASCSTQENYWPALAGALLLHELARFLAGGNAFQESLTLTNTGITLSRNFLPSDRQTWAPVLGNHLVHAATLHSSSGDHDAAAELLQEALEQTKWLAYQGRRQDNDPIVGFSVRRPEGPSTTDSLEHVLGAYIRELQELGRIDDLGAALGELVELRQTQYEADSGADQLLGLAWAEVLHARNLLDTGRDEEGVAATRRSLASIETLHDLNESQERARGTILHENALILARADRPDEALATISASVASYRDADTEDSSRELAAVLGDKSSLLSAAGRVKESLAVSEEALHIWRDLTASGSAQDRHGLAVAIYNRIRALHDAGLTDEAATLFNENQSLILNYIATDNPDILEGLQDDDSEHPEPGEASP
jgi:tetratricopeptide (TPR) repeat protein